MPIFEIQCKGCGWHGEVLVSGSGSALTCPECGGQDTQKMLSAPSSLTGRSAQAFPGPGDSTCCGSAPGHGACAGPGSCCGKTGL